MSKPLAAVTGPLTALLAALLVGRVLSLPVNILGYLEMSALPPGTDYWAVDLPWEAATGFFDIGIFLLEVVVVIVFFTWVHRATSNLRAFTAHPMSSTPGWSVGWYFIPFAGLFMPYRGMADIWQASHDQRAAKAPVVIWWLLALLWMGASTASLALTPLGETTGEYALAALYALPSEAIGVLFVALTLWIVRKTGVVYARNVTEQGGSFVIAPPGWYKDPSGQHELRLWDGSAWTESVHNPSAEVSPVAPTAGPVAWEAPRGTE